MVVFHANAVIHLLIAIQEPNLGAPLALASVLSRFGASHGFDFTFHWKSELALKRLICCVHHFATTFAE